MKGAYNGCRKFFKRFRRPKTGYGLGPRLSRFPGLRYQQERYSPYTKNQRPNKNSQADVENIGRFRSLVVFALSDQASKGVIGACHQSFFLQLFSFINTFLVNDPYSKASRQAKAFLDRKVKCIYFLEIKLRIRNAANNIYRKN